MMTRAATKKPKMRGWNPLGKMSRGPGGIIVEYAEAVDIGTAPEIYISGLFKVEQLGPGTIRFSFYSRRPEGNVIVLHTIWDAKTWTEDGHPTLVDARNRIVSHATGDGGRPAH